MQGISLSIVILQYKMMKSLILIIIIALIPRVVWSQYYIELNKANVTHYDSSYLIDIPINIENIRTNLFVQDPYNVIPIEAYININIEGGIRRIIDTVFVSHNKQIGEIGLQSTTPKKTITEYITTGYSKKDTLIDIDNRFKFYKQLQKQDKKDSILIYYSEFGGGSPCCYPDSVYQKAKKNSLENFIKSFEKSHHIAIGKLYGVQVGDEGEGIEYLTLSGLNKIQKLQFLTERSNTLSADKSEEGRLKFLKVYFPYWMSIKDLTSHYGEEKVNDPKVDTSIVYIYSDRQPRPVKSIDSFVALFKNIHFVNIPTVEPIMTFIVRRDGSLANVKVIRGGNEEIQKQVEEIVRKSPKWIPGNKNGIPVNVEYTTSLTTQPRPVEGISFFKMRFKNIHFVNVSIQVAPVISFAVSIDGSLSNVEVLRGGNEEIEKQVEDIIKNCPKWIPEKVNGIPVESKQYELSIDINNP